MSGRVHDASTAPRRRSVHFVPGGNERFMTKALASDADTIVLDLEDSVPPDRKSAARDAVAEWLPATVRESAARGRELMVRVNALDTPWGRDDIERIVPLGPRSLMVPKVSSLDDLCRVDDVVLPLDHHGVVGLFPVATETARAVFGLAELGHHHRVDGICWGAEDLSAALGSRSARDADGRLLPVFETVRHWCLLGARAGGVQAVDAVFTELGDLDGLRREARAAADMGFDGKITVHPDQIEIVNEAFTPSDDDVADATAMLEAFETARAEGRQAFTFRGQMVDAPHVARAERLLARAGRPRGDRSAGRS